MIEDLVLSGRYIIVTVKLRVSDDETGNEL